MIEELKLHRFTHEAMATRFELTLVHADGMTATQAAQEVFADIDRLESQISRYIPHSDISRINGSAADSVIEIEEAAMDCLSYGRDIWAQTGGAFDVTIGPLLVALRWPNGFPRDATKEELAAAVARSGFAQLHLDPGAFTATPLVDDMLIDLGAIGKGYALDQAAVVLRTEHGITNALLNAGSSTVLGMGALPGEDGWLVRAGAPEPFLLRDEAVSGTGFQIQGAHVIDPRHAQLVNMSRTIRWAIAPNATLADALSTAFMVMSRKEITLFCNEYPEVKVIYVE